MHVLIIDVEFLIALESEHVLCDALGCSAEIAVPRDTISVLERGGADVILIDTDLVTPPVAALLHERRRTGTGLVFASVDSDHRHGLPGFPGVPVVFKPFDDLKLVQAVKSASEGQFA